MAKKKKKGSDFQKVKLKVGRRLVRGLNETKTDFKSKKIVVKELESRAKDPIKTLSNLSVNTQTKLFCLNNVDKWLDSNNINSRGGEVVTTVSKYLTDSDRRVRDDCLKCLKHCISLLHRKQGSVVSPLMPVILTYINCGLTHIDDHISNDSLKLLSHFIDFSDKSLFSQLMQTINTLLERKSRIDANTLEVCHKLLSVMCKDESESDHKMKKEPVILKWSPQSYYCDIHDRNYNFGAINLTFQTSSSVDIKKNFLLKIEFIVRTELKLLFPKTCDNLDLSVTDARKAVAAVKMALLLDLSPEVMRKIPNISVSGINGTQKSNKKQSQLISHLRSEINSSLNKFKNNVN